MSQEGIVNVVGSNPMIPTTFVANVGTAVPIANTLEILGSVVTAGTHPLRTIGSGNTIDIQAQISQAIGASNATNIGLAAFNSAQFTVDGNGFVSLSGSGSVETFTVDAATPPGTNPVGPNGSGTVIVTGGQVAAGTTTNVIQTNSLAANTYAVQIQRSSAQATTTIGANGVAHFSSDQFSVDANGFVTLVGGGEAVDSFSPDSGTDPVVPTAAGLINDRGSGSITTVGSLNTITTQLTGLTNHALLVGAGTTTITKVGPTATAGQVLQSAGSSADPAFSTATYPSVATGTGTILRADGTNWSPTTSTYPITNAVSTLLYASSANVMAALATANNGVLITSATGVPSILPDGTTGQILTATTGSPPSWVSPATSGTVTTVSVVTANGFAGTVANPTTTPAITLTTSITGILTGNGTSMSGSTVTQHGVLVGGATNAVSSTSVGSTGQVLQANTSADPTYSTATYPSTATGTGKILRADGTNWSATTATYPNTAGTSGNVLTSDGTNWNSTAPAGGGGVAKVLVQTFTSSGTYTPTSGMLYCIIELVGGGGGSGGCAATTTSLAVTGGGGGGGYARLYATSATIGSSQTVTVGAGGLAGTSGNHAGGTGGTTSVGSLCIAAGGVGSSGSAATTNTVGTINEGGAGGTGSTGSFLSNGSPAGYGLINATTGGGGTYATGTGGSSFFGGGATGVVGTTTTVGRAGTNYGSGASGSGNNQSQSATAGSAGKAGVVMITEFTT